MSVVSVGKLLLGKGISQINVGMSVKSFGPLGFASNFRLLFFGQVDDFDTLRSTAPFVFLGTLLTLNKEEITGPVRAVHVSGGRLATLVAF